MASWLLFSSFGLGLYKTGYHQQKLSPKWDSIMNKQTSHVSHYPETKEVKRLQRLQEPHCEKNNDHTIKTNTIFHCLVARSWWLFFSCRIKTSLPPLNFLKKPVCSLAPTVSWGHKEPVSVQHKERFTYPSENQIQGRKKLFWRHLPFPFGLFHCNFSDFKAITLHC